MANGVLHTLKRIAERLDEMSTRMESEFNHLSTALGEVFRELDDIKERLPVRKADKRGRRAVHPKSQI